MRILSVLCLFCIMSMTHSAEYFLGVGDKIEIKVYDEPDLTIKTKVDKTGLVNFPFLGDIQVIGLTTKQVENTIKNGLLGDYLIDPQVNVTIAVYRPFFIHGQVKLPGGYPFQDDLTLDKAIAIAGGLTSRASKDDWKITRNENGKKIIIEVQVSTAIRPDDTIMIEQSFF